MLKLKKIDLENIFYSLIFFSSILISQNSFAADSLSYSGRLVKADGAPVAGPVDLTLDLAYTNAPGTILCSQNFNNVILSNGVFHLKLDLVCPGPPPKTLTEILSAVPPTFAAALRVTDVNNSKVYAFQALHAMPFANIAETSKQLLQLGAANGEVLKWNDTTKKWEPGTPGGGGTVTNVTVTSPLAVLNGATTPALSIAQATATVDGYLSSTDWNTFNNKIGVAAGGTVTQFYRGDKSWQTLNTDAVPDAGMTNLYFTNARALGVPLAGFTAGTGAIVATDTTLAAFGKAQGQINVINTVNANFLVKNGTDSITGVVNVGTIGLLQLDYAPTGLNDATNKSYVDSVGDLKVRKSGDTMSGILTLDSDLKIKGGVNYVTLRGHATSAAYNLILPSTAGTSGYVLQTDGLGNLSWINPSSTTAGTGTVSSASIVDGTIVDADVSATAAIAQSKIANLTTDLAAKQSTTLTNGNILVGSATNVATGVALSGDATIINTGALTLKNTGTAGTYSQVTTDAQGRVTSGSNPTVVTAVSVTAPITNTGTAAIPAFAMPAATTSVDGYLSSTDWNTFNNKQAAITAATTINTGSVTSNLQGGVVVNPYGTAAGNTGEIRFNELVANGVNYVALKAPDALIANVVYTFPLADGSSGQVLTTNAAGGLSWTTVATGGTTLVGDIGGTIGANTIGAGKVTLTHMSATGTKNNTTYLRGDNTWAVFGNDVLSTSLTGLSLITTGVIATTDSVIAAFGKLQKQISDLTTSAVGGDLTGTLPNPTIAKLQGAPLTITTPAAKNVLKYNGTAWVNSMITASDLSATGTTDATTYLAGDNTWKGFNSGVIAAPLTGLNSTGITKATGTLAATDSITAAFNKLLFTQGDYVSKSVDQTINGTLAINSLTGFITVPTPVGINDAANKGYVDGFGQWSKGTGANAADIYRSSGKVGIGTATPGVKLQVSGQDLVDNGILVRNESSSLNTYPSSVVENYNGTGIGHPFVGMRNSGGSYSSPTALPANNVLGAFVFYAHNGTQFIEGGRASFISRALPNATTVQTDYELALSNGTSESTVLNIKGATGNVGIGTTTPDSKLTVGGNVHVTGNSQYIVDVGVTPTTGIFGNFGVPGGNEFGISRPGVQMLTFNVSSGNSYFSTGNVGIGTAAPQTKLDVNGAIRVGVDATACSAAIAGAMRFNTPNVEYCNGTSWSAFGISGAAVTSTQITDGTIVDADVSATANIAATKLGTGVVDNIEFNYLDGITSSIQTQLNNKQPLDATLTSLAGYNTNGILVQTAADTFVGRSITGTTNRVTVTNGDGVIGNPTVNVSAALLPSPLVGDAGKFLKTTAADTSLWSALSSSDITTALGFTPVNKAGDSITTGTLAFSGTAALTAQNPVNLLDVANKQYVDGFGQWTKSGSDVYRASGNVGIGTTTPSSKLDVVGTTATDYLRVDAQDGVAEGGEIQLVGAGVNGTVQLDNYAGNIRLHTLAPGKQFHILGGSIYADGTTAANYFAGNVGIGTSIPNSVLTVDGGAGVLSLKPGATIDHTYLQLFARSASPTVRSAYIGYPGAGSTLLNISNEISGGHIGLLTSGAGNVGIGTSAPSEKLTIAGDGRAIFGPNTTWGANLIVGGNGYAGPNASVVTTNGNLHLDAKVGAFATYANWYAGTGFHVGNGATTYGPAYAASFNISSDRRLKTNIVNIQHPLDIIDQLNGVRFDWINSKESRDRQVGVIAQDVQKVLPELVSVNNETKRLSVNYSGLVSPLIEAVKELYHRWMKDSDAIHREVASVKANSNAKILIIEEENRKLKKENAEIKDRLERIEKTLKLK